MHATFNICSLFMHFFLFKGNYSRLAVHIQFGRSFGYTVMSTYIPAATLVLLSWVPLWFNGGDALISRILTGVISVRPNYLKYIYPILICRFVFRLCPYCKFGIAQVCHPQKFHMSKQLIFI